MSKNSASIVSDAGQVAEKLGHFTARTTPIANRFGSIANPKSYSAAGESSSAD
jgi:hypothetical protein